MRPSRIRAKISRGEPALCTTLTLSDPSLFELTSSMGFDGIWLDLEHHAHSVETAASLMRAARVGTADIVARPAKGEFMRMGRLLEAGAQAIMYPRCDSVEEAAEVVRWAKFAPLGQRGFDGGNADADYGAAKSDEYPAYANHETLLIIQLESQQAVNQAEAIAAVPGVDLIMLGPGDFCVLEGIAAKSALDRIQAAHRQIASAAERAGKLWAAAVAGLAEASQLLELEAKVLFFGADSQFIRHGLEKMQTDFAALGFRFDK